MPAKSKVPEKFSSTKRDGLANHKEELQEKLRQYIRKMVKEIMEELKSESQIPQRIPFSAAGESVDSTLKEGGMGFLGKDDADILGGIVMTNRKLPDEKILAIARTQLSPDTKSISDEDMLSYIEDTRTLYKLNREGLANMYMPRSIGDEEAGIINKK